MKDVIIVIGLEKKKIWILVMQKRENGVQIATQKILV